MAIVNRVTSAVPLALLIAITLNACAKTDGAADKPKGGSAPVKIVAQPITMETDSVVIKAIGTARAKRSAIIYPDSRGEVNAVNFVAGDRVEKYTVLVELDAREESLAVQRSVVALKDGQQLLRRYERIKVPGAISASQVDAGRIAVQTAELQQQQAELALEKRTVRAPFAGHVGLTNIDPGARIDEQTEITRLDDRSTLYVDFAAPEEAFSQIKITERLEVRSFAYPDQVLEARVLTTDSRLNPTSRSLTVRTEIDNADDQLRPGMSFRVEFTVAGQQYPAVPEAAIVWGGDGAYLWAVRENKAQRVPLTIIARKNGRVLVRAPLPEGSLIVAEGVHKIREGAPVTAVNPDQEPDQETVTKAAKNRERVQNHPVEVPRRNLSASVGSTGVNATRSSTHTSNSSTSSTTVGASL